MDLGIEHVWALVNLYGVVRASMVLVKLMKLRGRVRLRDKGVQAVATSDVVLQSLRWASLVAAFLAGLVVVMLDPGVVRSNLALFFLLLDNG